MAEIFHQIEKTTNNDSNGDLLRNWISVTSLNTIRIEDSFPTLINATNIFYNKSLITNIDITKLKLNNASNIYGMFFNCRALANLKLDSSWNTSKVTNMAESFYSCRSLTSLNILSNFNTGNVTNMYSMFGGGYNLTNLDGLSNWNVSNVTDMDQMFFYCRNLTNIQAVSKWNTGKVKDMHFMFYSLQNLVDVDLSMWNMSSVTNIDGMFARCNSLSNASLQNIARMCLNATKVSIKVLNINSTSSPVYGTTTQVNAATIGSTLVSQLQSAGWEL